MHARCGSLACASLSALGGLPIFTEHFFLRVSAFLSVSFYLSVCVCACVRAMAICITAGQLALRWILAHPAVTCCIPGCRTTEHVKSNLAAAKMSKKMLPEGVLIETAAVYVCTLHKGML